MAQHICESRFENDLKTIVYFTNSGKTETAEDQTGRAKPPESERKRYDDDFRRRYRYRQIVGAVAVFGRLSQYKGKNEEIPSGTIALDGSAIITVGAT